MHARSSSRWPNASRRRIEDATDRSATFLRDAADAALTLDPGFDPGAALRALVDAELVAASATGTQESQR